MVWFPCFSQFLLMTIKNVYYQVAVLHSDALICMHIDGPTVNYSTHEDRLDVNDWLSGTYG